MVLICCSFCYKKRTCDNSHVHLALALSTAVAGAIWHVVLRTALVPCLFFKTQKVAHLVLFRRGKRTP